MQVPGIKDLDYEDRLQELNLPTLFYQCLCGDMIEVYELTLGLYDPWVSIMLPNYTDHVMKDCGLRGHQKAVQK